MTELCNDPWSFMREQRKFRHGTANPDHAHRVFAQLQQQWPTVNFEYINGGTRTEEELSGLSGYSLLRYLVEKNLLIAVWEFNALVGGKRAE